MSLAHLVPTLLPPPGWTEGGQDVLLPHARRVFALRDIHFQGIQAVGFDMDYTLSHYRAPEIDELAFRRAAALLVSGKGYPAWLLETDYDPDFAIRGLVLDGNRGNLLKLGAERLVVRASHGTRMLDRQATEAAYGRRRVSASAEGFRSIDTLFEIPECTLYAVLVDAIDAGTVQGVDYLQLFRDIRWAIDTAHRNGEMKAEILADKDFYILRDPELPMALDRWKRAGKKLFVVSNSEWAFTDGVLGHLLDGLDPARPSWKDYFDLVVTSARKPVFFEEAQPAVALPGEPAAYAGGNAAWLEEWLGARGEEILYVGDHIFGDILRSKKNVSWHTLLLIPELGQSLQHLEQLAGDLQGSLGVEAERRQAEARASILEDRLQRNRDHRRLLASRLSPEALHALDQEAEQLRLQGAEANLTLAALERRGEDLGRHLARAFNARWGSIFRDGHQQTRFADQIQQYACAYTGRISNFYLLDPGRALYAPVPTLPHERI